MDIRRATPDDAAALARLHVDSWRTAYRGLVPQSHLDSLNYDRRARRFRESLARHAEETYLAEQDGDILGFLTLGGCRDEDVGQEAAGEIWGIYLAPKHWRKGIGRLLCRYGERILRSRGCRLATLWVLAGNEEARRFYEAMGYEADGATRTLTPGAPLEAVRYRRGLGDAEPPAAADGKDAAAGPAHVHGEGNPRPN
jgi:ribosomal protein S18 acetylase RimI-like enzyme